uniref:Nucleoprotein TPR n=1 Tax=Ascaris lumbricoides TaxID=6252 RepID=A0A9J2PZM7_ASCLU
MIQNRLEHSDSEKLKQLDDQLTIARSENENLRKFVSEISEQHRIISLDLKMTSSKVTTERDQALASKKCAEDRLSWKENELAQLQAKYDELIRQINAPDALADTTVEGYKKDAQQLRNKNNYLENQLKDFTAKLEACEKKLAIRESELENFSKVSGNLESSLVEQSAVTCEKKLAIRESELENFSKVSGNLESSLVEQSASSAAERRSLQSMLEVANQQLNASTATVAQLRGEIFKLEQRVSEESMNTATVAQLRGEIFKLEQRVSEESMKCEQLKISAQKEVSEVEKRLTSAEALRTNAEARISELNEQIAQLTTQNKMLEEEQSKLKQNISKLQDEAMVAQNRLSIAENARAQTEMQLEEARKASAAEIAVLRVEKRKLEEEMNETRELNKQQMQKIGMLNDQLMKLSERVAFLERANDPELGTSGGAPPRSASALYDLSERVAFLERANDPELGTSGGAPPRSASALYDVIKYLQLEHEKEAERTMNAELHWKRLQAQQAAVEERSAKLEEEVSKLRSNAEESVRIIAEKSEMVSRLTLLQGVQKENDELKSQIGKQSAANDQLTKMVNGLKLRLAALEAEKVAETSKLQNAMTDLQNARKEMESWKGRHAQAMSALGKCGPERVLNLTSEVENLKRKLQAMTSERDNAKQEVAKLVESADASTSSGQTIESLKNQLQGMTKQRNDMHGKFEQARALARQYRMKSQNLEKEQAELKEQLAAKQAAVAATAADESSKEEVNKLTQQLQAAQNELDQYKQKLSATRTGWPVEQQATSTAAQNKATALIQTQMKQIEALSQQNKALTKQLEEVSNRFKESQAKLTEMEAKIEKLQSESDSKEELHFRLNSITSMANKREAELAKLREEVDAKKVELEESEQKVRTLETELKQLRDQLCEQGKTQEESKERPSAAAAALEPTSAGVARSVSSSTTPVAIGTLPASEMSGSTTIINLPGTSPAIGAIATTGILSTGAASAPTGPAAVAQFSFSAPSRSASSISASPITSPFIAAAKTEITSGKGGASVSTTSEQLTTTSSTKKKVVGTIGSAPGTDAIIQPLAASSSAKAGFGASGGFQFGLSSSFKTTFGGTATAAAGLAAANQSNAVSQSSAPPSISTSAGVVQQHKPAQQNELAVEVAVISGSGDGTNVISSSGVAHSSGNPPIPPTSSVSLGSIASSAKKRPFTPSDQSSSMETGSEIQDPIKRQRASPTEQVSTSGRFVQSSSDTVLAHEKLASVDDDEAEQEQQESVETTTNPEDEGVGEDFLAEDADTAEHVASEDIWDVVMETTTNPEDEGVGEDFLAEDADTAEHVASETGEVMEDGGAEQHGDGEEEEELQEDMEGEAGDEEVLIDEEQGDDLDETLGEGDEEEYEDEMEEEEDEYDEGEDDFDEEDEEEISESRQHFVGRVHARNIAVPPMRSVAQRRNVEEEDDEDIILIEDDDEEGEGDRAVDYSHSPADQSMDEADEGVGRVPRVDEDADTSLDEPNRAERENDDRGGRRVQSHDLGEVRDANDHLELQQATGSRLESNSSQKQLSKQLESHADGGDVRVAGTNSEAVFLPAGEMELSQSLDTAPPAAEAGDDFSVNIESDSRGASSTVTPLPAADLGRERADAEGLMRGEEEEGGGGNEVAEEEQAEKRAPQTDDEGATEPSTSEVLPHRRIRIRYPDIDEPSSSSNDGPQGTRTQPATRGGRGARGRIGRGPYFGV